MLIAGYAVAITLYLILLLFQRALMHEIAVLKIGELNQNSFRNDFYISTITEHLKYNHTRIEKPHKHNFYATMLFTKGSGIHEIDFNSYEVRPGSIFLLAPGQTHSWVLSEDVEGYIFFHTQAFLDLFYVREVLREYPIFRRAYYNNGFLLEGSFLEEVSLLFRRILKEHSEQQWKQDLLLSSLITQLHIELNRFVLALNIDSPLHNGQYNLLFQAFEDFLEHHFKEEKSATFYAEQLHITPKHLNRICQALVETTTSSLIADRVVLEAKRLLIYTGKSVAEIALFLGYDDYSYFSKLFKKKVGETPKQFVKRYE